MGSGIHRSDDGPKNGPKLVTFVINCVANCVVHDGTPMDASIDYAKREQQITLRNSIKYQKALNFK